MSAIGSGYDLSCQTFSPDGKVFQVDYAMKAVENSSSAVAMKCKDGIVYGVEKIITSKMLESSSNKRTFVITKNIGMVCAGFLPDAVYLSKKAHEEVDSFKKLYGIDISVKTLAQRLSSHVHHYTMYGYFRPLGCSMLISGYDHHGYSLYHIDPSGTCIGYLANGIGKGKVICKNELEKVNLKEMTCREGIIKVIQILDACHEEWKDKQYDLELCWVCDETQHIVKKISKELKEEFIQLAREQRMDED